eukprot:6180527-Pleurochrysis_carterae.AAC.1
MFARTDNRGGSVRRIVGYEVSRDRERRARGRVHDRGVVAGGTALQEALIHGVPKNIVVFTTP